MALTLPGGRALAGAFYSFLILGLVGYFSFSAVQGEYGLARKIEIEALERDLAAELDARRGEREKLANLVRRLSDDYLDLDLLDERARNVLGLARPDEIIIR
ncbi:MAG: septum formation initiator [Paracoccaceae bacterium]|nr:MAG: septum formation initiator family protein [Alphaproteobacteria bacterium]GIX13165.1 MAG: septum formation initiator [Paracoccaceae bacterium]